MKILNRIDNYLSDNELKIIILKNSINIINYDEIIDFSLNQIKISVNKQIIIIDGKNLTINKMIDNEILIIGNIFNISIN